MRLSKAKDIVIRAYFNNTPISQKIPIDNYDKQAALFDLDKEDYIKIREVSTTGSGHIRKYAFESMLPKGAHFVTTNQSFRRKAIWEWISELPKKYWFVPIIASAILVIGKDLALMFLNKNKEPPKMQIQVKPQVSYQKNKDDSLSNAKNADTAKYGQ